MIIFKCRFAFIISSLLIVFSFSPIANAEIEDNDSFNNIVERFQEQSSEWEGAISNAAQRLFFLLVAIDLAWMAIMMLFKKQDMLDFLGSLIQRIMIIGFFLILLTNGTSWALIVVNSFRDLATNAGGLPSILPSTIMDIGVNLAADLIEKSSGNSLLNLGNMVLSGLLGIVILFTFALITAEVIVVLVSMYIILNAGIIMLAFGGSRWTEQFAVNYYKTVLAIGVRLFVLYLLIGLGISVIQSLINDLSPDEPTFAEMFVVTGTVIVLYFLVKSISSLVQSLISGSGDTSTGGTGALIGGAVGLAGGAAAGASAVGGAATGGIKSAVGAGQAVNSARNIAAEGISSQGGQTAASRSFGAVGGAIGGSAGAKAGEALGLGLSKVAGTVMNLGKEAASDYGAQIKGEMGSNMGTKGGRMSQRMKDKSELNKMEKGSNDKNTYISGVPENDKK
jgi:type IV secretion system protein TrbL